MKKFTICMLLSVCTAAWFGCSTKDSPTEIKNVAKKFFTALARQDYDEAARYATPETKASLELMKNLVDMGKKMADSFKSEENDSENTDMEAKLSKVVYGEPVIEGEKAKLPITVDNETNNIYLKKIDGAWKVAFDKSSLKQIMSDQSGKSIDEINDELDSSAEELQNMNMDSVKEALNKASDLLKSDSLQKILNASGDVMKMVSDAMKEMSKEGKQ